MGTQRSYARFYYTLKKLTGADKEMLVSDFTNGRTTSLKEMTVKEYNSCCEAMEKAVGCKDLLRKKRSICLKLIQGLGVNTADWQRVNDFCLHNKIAGKSFAQLTIDDLEILATKLRAIMRKGGLSALHKPVVPKERGSVVISVPLNLLEC